LAAPAATTSGDALNSIGSEQNPFLGSVSKEKIQPGTVSLTILDAINRGLKYNLGLYLPDQSTLEARGARLRELSALLPNVSARVGESLQQINLAAYGFPVPAGQSAVIGPFAVFDARAALTQSVLDFSAINNTRASTQSLQAAQFSYKNARDLVVLVVGGTYLQAVSGAARVEAVEAQLKTAQTTFQQATDLKSAGMVAGIDVLRAQVEMQAQQQRLLVARNDFEKQKLLLARVIGLPEGQQFALADKVPYAPAPQLTLESALQRAFDQRPDYKQFQAQVRAAEFAVKARKSEHFPTLGVTGDYGIIGQTPGNSHGTFTAAAALRVPIFEGGRIRGEVLQAESRLSQSQARLENLRGQIEHDVRTALLDVNAAAQQIELAENSRQLAREQLQQSQDRFAAGIAGNLEVVQAQEAVATAEENYISSLFSHNIAKLRLARALGVAEEATKKYLGGL
jgi:outer membrane protein TolC